MRGRAWAGPAHAQQPPLRRPAHPPRVPPLRATPRPAPKPHDVLGVPPDATPAEARAAWLALIRDAHPDAASGGGRGGSGDDGDPSSSAAATVRAAELNAAYEALTQGARGSVASSRASGDDDGGGDLAFAPGAGGAPADTPFFSPFALPNFDPFRWRELQGLVRAPDAPARLAAARLREPPGGVPLLTPAQAAAAERVLEAMEDSLDVFAAAQELEAVLAAAAAANAAPPRRRRRGAGGTG